MSDQAKPKDRDSSGGTGPARAVTLFVVPNCPLCADARAWLRANGVPFVERDVARDFGALRAMYRLTRQNLVPVFERGGRALVRPSDEELARLCSE
jgi:arsenate reductase-like glutaredoxin family protein